MTSGCVRDSFWKSWDCLRIYLGVSAYLLGTVFVLPWEYLLDAFGIAFVVHSKCLRNVSGDSFYWFVDMSQRQVEGALNNGGKQKRAASHKRYSSCLSRDYWTRTSDLAPPRRVRYQLRQIPIAYALLNICGCKGMILFWNEQIFNRFLQFFRIHLCFFSDSWWTFCSFTLLY